jgi:hypothetical protein
LFLNFKKQIESIGGSGLLSVYKGSPVHLLSTVYPEYNWLPWKFSNVPVAYWTNVNNIKQFVNWISSQLNVTNLNDITTEVTTNPLLC